MSDKALKMVTCSSCETKVFIPGDLAPLATVPCSKCGAPIMMPMLLRQFELRSFVASGGNGTVYRGWDTVLERLVAVKLLKNESLQDPTALESFYREARACARLNHTNIIHIYTFDEWEGLRYLVMELADRGSLDTRIEKQVRVDELARARHRHQDCLRPRPRAQAQSDSPRHQAGEHSLRLRQRAEAGGFWPRTQSRCGTGIREHGDGTPYYVAPEKINREKETFLSDMYSLGATLYHALTGAVPFDAPTVEELVAAQVRTPLTPPISVLPEITQATNDALVKTMAKNPSDRFLSYDEFIMSLESARSLLLRERSSSPQSQNPAKSKGLTSWWRR